MGRGRVPGVGTRRTPDGYSEEGVRGAAAFPGSEERTSSRGSSTLSTPTTRLYSVPRRHTRPGGSDCGNG